MKAYYAKAYPKINITLKIGEKIGNLHTLQSRFCLVESSLYDSFLIIKEPLDNEVLTQKDLVKKLPQRYTTFSETTKQHNAIQCYLYGNFDCKLEDNLIYKAYMLLAKHIDSNINPCSIHIIVDKRIPVGGGLGGGSVNAALMLLLLNELFNLNCSKEILYQHAKALGSDVAFFLMIYTQNSTHITPYFYAEQNLSKGDLDSILFKQTQDENLDSNICHVERSKISKDLEMIKESKQDSNIESKKDISCLRTRTSESLAHTCKYDRNLDSKLINHANKTTNSSDCSMALEALSELEGGSYLDDNDYPSNSLNRSNCIDKGANLENLDTKHNIYFNEKIDSKTQIDFIKINCNLSKALYLLSYFMPLNAIYYSRGVGSLSAIKLTHVFLHTLALSSDIKIYATNSFYFSQTNEIKAFANMSFYLKPDSKHVVITDSNVKDYIHIAPSNINASNINDSLDLSTLFLPYRLIHNDFLESCTPLYVTPAV